MRARRRGGRGDAVRGADRGGVRRLRRARRRRRRRRSRARRPARRDERARRGCRAADERRARAHRGARRDARARSPREKLAVAHEGAVVVLPDGGVRARSWPVTRCRLGGAPARRRRRTSAARRRRRGGGRARRAGSSCATARCGTAPTTPEAVDWLLERLPRPPTTSSSPRSSPTRTSTRSCERSRRAGRTLIATRSSNERALPAAEVAARATAFAEVEEVARSGGALSPRAPGELGRPVLVTGSLYLLADLSETD